MPVWLVGRHLETDLKVFEWGFSETHDISFVEMEKVSDNSFHREMSKEPDSAGGGGCLHGESNKSQPSARLWVLWANTSPWNYVSSLSNCHC